MDEMKIYENVIASLGIVKRFLNVKTYRALKAACEVAIPSEYFKYNRAMDRNRKKPTVYDFFDALSTISSFVRKGSDANERATLNAQGIHSQSILVVMDILLKNMDFMSMADICNLIDIDDANEEARLTRKTLMTTKNNMIRKKDDSVVESKEIGA